MTSTGIFQPFLSFFLSPSPLPPHPSPRPLAPPLQRPQLLILLPLPRLPSLPKHSLYPEHVEQPWPAHTARSQAGRVDLQAERPRGVWTMLLATAALALDEGQGVRWEEKEQERERKTRPRTTTTTRTTPPSTGGAPRCQPSQGRKNDQYMSLIIFWRGDDWWKKVCQGC